MLKEFFRGVVWPRKPRKSSKDILYRYVVVGMMVTNEPLGGLEGNQFILNGYGAGIADAIESIKHIKSDVPLGDAVDVLTNLDTIIETRRFNEVDDD